MSAHEWGTENRSMRGNFQVSWDSTSLGLFKTCPRKYYLTQIEGWVKKRTPTPLWFGICFHDALEYAEKLKVEDQDRASVLRQVVRRLHETNGHREYYIDQQWKTSSEIDANSTEVFDCEHTRWVPFDPDDSKRNLWTLMRSVIWYIDKFWDDPAETLRLSDGSAAVELSFSIELPKTLSETGESYILSGHIDRIVKFMGKKWTLDYKTSGNGLGDFFWANFSPNNQVSLYTLAGKIAYAEDIAGVIINGIELAVGHNRFSRGFVPRTAEQNEEFLHDMLWWIGQAEQCAKDEHWPMNDESCGKYGGCVFRDICNKSPAVREKFLKADFKRQVWDPSRPR